MMKQVMVKAWELAKNGVKKFGGNVKQYFASALAIAWKELKTMSQAIGKIEFPYCKKYEVCAVASVDSDGYVNQDKIKPSKVENTISYTDLEDGFYGISRFGEDHKYVQIKNGENTDVTVDDMKVFYNGAEKKVNKAGAVIKFPYAKKHWLAEITGPSAIYRLERQFQDYEEIDNEIVYAGLTDGVYQISKFDNPGQYFKIENGAMVEMSEQDVLEMFDAPEKGMNEKQAREYMQQDDATSERYEFSFDVNAGGEDPSEF